MPSLRSRAVATLIPLLRGASEVVDTEAFRARKLAAQAAARTDPPRRVLRGFEVTEVDGVGFPVHDLRVAGTTPTRTLFYLHGGGFVSHADTVHWRYVARLARRFDLRVVFPVYPLTPTHTWRDATEPLLRLFEQVAIESPGGVVLAGDSAGGGLALALAQQIARRPGPQPTHLVLVAPWVDLTDTTPGTIEAAGRDPWLKLSRLRICGAWWAGGDDVTRPEVSPVNGDLAGLPPALMWCGTRDLLQPQCRRLADRAVAEGWPLRYVEEPGLIHVYPILPIPEARRALAELAGFLA
ncbi:alpha/beta hydrolase fold domain-containing protein [Nocardioides pakistanensis]